MYLSSFSVHIPDDFKFDFSRGDLTGFDCVFQGHSQGASTTDVEDFVIGLDAALLAGWGSWHHLQTVDPLPPAANTSRQLYTWRGKTRIAETIK